MKQSFELIEFHQMFTNKLAYNLTRLENKIKELQTVEWDDLLPTEPKMRTHVIYKENIFVQKIMINVALLEKKITNDII